MTKSISYDDEHACQAKVSFARNMHLGGVMIWELGEGYRATQPAGQRDTLLQSIKQAMATPGKAAVHRNGPDMQISFASAPLGLYRVLWASNSVPRPFGTLLPTTCRAPNWNHASDRPRRDQFAGRAAVVSDSDAALRRQAPACFWPGPGITTSSPFHRRHLRRRPRPEREKTGGTGAVAGATTDSSSPSHRTPRPRSRQKSRG